MKSILMKPHLVAQTFAGNKTQTRRVIKKLNSSHRFYGATLDGYYFLTVDKEGCTDFKKTLVKPKYSVGETIYVKEKLLKYLDSEIAYSDGQVAFPNDARWCWKRDVLSPLFMPRGLARLFIKITNVRVERLQDISEEDAVKEGIFHTDYSYKCLHGEGCPLSGKHHQRNGWSWKKTKSQSECLNSARFAFANMWNSIHEKDESKSWDANPWVFVYEFERVEKP